VPACRRLLVLGGSRSGKSGYAQLVAEASGLSVVFVATAEAFDEEMRARIERHRRDRHRDWRTREEPIGLLDALAEESRAGTVVLVDCLTLWLSNVMLAGHDAETASEHLVAAIAKCAGPVILVSNEVGSGIVPDSPLGRSFRDRQGWLNQAVAGCCDAVVAVTAGCPQLVKPAPAFELSLR
jgi:adenosylcobinamide kinase/adenosylcobinamide-phosphate guanylyltransferase